MEFLSGERYFYSINKKLKKYSYLNKNINCDILIIGGGINGAILNYRLSKKYDVVLVEKSRIGANLTSMATALLEYQLDSFKTDLESNLTTDEIVSCYKLGLNSIDKIEKIVKKLKNTCHFNKRPTLIFSNSEKDKKEMYEEYLFRKNNGFDCEFITKENNPFNFELNSGILCNNGGAEFDPYLFTKMMIQNSNNQNRIFENTEIIEINKCTNGYICKCKYGETIFCREVILATGFDFGLTNANICTRFISYSIVTNKLKEITIQNNTLIQDFISPYHYLRKLPDERLIFGGEDTKIKDKIDVKKANDKYQNLLKILQNMFPNFKEKIKIEYCFCGAFGMTENNMALIGRDNNEIINFLSCGANGIINAFKGVEIVENLLKNIPTKIYENIFSPLREV